MLNNVVKFCFANFILLMICANATCCLRRVCDAYAQYSKNEEPELKIITNITNTEFIKEDNKLKCYHCKEHEICNVAECTTDIADDTYNAIFKRAIKTYATKLELIDRSTTEPLAKDGFVCVYFELRKPHYDVPRSNKWTTIRGCAYKSKKYKLPKDPNEVNRTCLFCEANLCNKKPEPKRRSKMLSLNDFFAPNRILFERRSRVRIEPPNTDDRMEHGTGFSNGNEIENETGKENERGNENTGEWKHCPGEI